MSGEQIITLLTAQGGTGKTAFTVTELFNKWLDEPTMRFLHNLPLNVETIAKKYVAAYGGDEATILSRFERIPHDVEQSWIKDFSEGGSGPWEYCHGRDMKGVMLIVDEAHSFWSSDHSRKHSQKWTMFFATLRHRGMRAWLITQNLAQLSHKVEKLAGRWILLMGAEHRLVPWLGIPYNDLYELIAKFFTGVYLAQVWPTDQYKEGKQWFGQEGEPFVLQPWIFELYDSYDAPKEDAGGAAVSWKEKRQFEQRGYLNFLCWFASRNLVPLGGRTMIIGFFAWLTIGGGYAWAFSYALNRAYAGLQKPPSVNPSLPVSPGKHLPSEKILPQAPIVEIDDAQAISHQELRYENHSGGDRPVETTSRKPLWQEYQPLGFVDGRLVISDGRTIGPGEEIEEGQPEKVTAVDSARRVFFVDGVRHRLQVNTKRLRDDNPPLRRPLPESASRAGSSSNDGQQSSQDRRPRNDFASRGEPSSQRMRPVAGGRPGSGGENDFSQMRSDSGGARGTGGSSSGLRSRPDGAAGLSGPATTR